MDINYEINAELFDNKDKFDHDFFKRFELTHARPPLELSETVSKQYLFPTLYGDVRCAIGIFLCDYDAAKAMMPHSSMQPLSMSGGRALVAFSNYTYRNVLGVRPYNEIAMAIPVLTGAAINPPVLPIVMDRWFAKFGYYIFSMPVTSLENRIRGRNIWGLPKDVNRLDIDVEGDVCTTVAFNEQGDKYLEISVPTQGTSQDFDVESNLYSVLDGLLLQSPTYFKGTFNLTKNMGKLFGRNPANAKSALAIVGDSVEAQRLRDLKIDPVPFQTRYTNSMNSCFALSNSNFKQPK